MLFSMRYDIIIVGGGIIGVSTAWQLQQRYPNKKILLLEKESQLAHHQTGHNSGVIHAGVYYQPGSLKADFCKQGSKDTIDFCKEHDIPFEQCGKLIVATNELELQRMQALYKRCQQNDIDVALLNEAELEQREQHITGLGAIHVGASGIVDYKQICQKMATLFMELGGECKRNAEVYAIQENGTGVTLSTRDRRFDTDFLVVCAGLMADRLTRMQGLRTDFRIVPFRGEYYQLPSEKNSIVRHLIYPVPDPELPFLGVHLTRMIDGTVTVGPNAVLGWKREGYGKINFDPVDVTDMLIFSGFWRVLRQNLRSGLTEVKNSVWKKGYLKMVQKYCPELGVNDLQPYPAGVRAQAVLKDGSLVHDFLFAESPRSLHVCNAPSPAATSAIPIGRYICSKLDTRVN